MCSNLWSLWAKCTLILIMEITYDLSYEHLKMQEKYFKLEFVIS